MKYQSLNLRHLPPAKRKRQVQNAFDIGLEWMVQGKIKTEHLVIHKFGLESNIDMIQTNLAKGRHKTIKTVMSFIQQS